MDEKISLEAISIYADSYAEKVLKDFFARKDSISGNEILALSNVQQVNLFIIKELFEAWQEEIKKFKSPYFNFDHPDVREAFDHFMATLSQNIKISRIHFAPLLKKAASQTLLLIFNPYDFYAMMVAGKDNRLHVGTFREGIKYLKINRAPLERMLQKLEHQGVSEISGNEAFGILDQILEEVNFTPEDVESYIRQFSQVLPLDPFRFYVSLPAPPQVPKSSPPKEEKNHATLNDRHQAPSRPTVVQNFQKIARIKDNLTINQKFMFTKVLFHGDFELFTRAVDRLDQMDNLPAAMRYIENEYATTWDRDSEEFHEFMELVEKRFS